MHSAVDTPREDAAGTASVAAIGPGARPSAAGGAIPDSFPRLRALDGLRGLAVVAVLVYHFRPTWLPAGFLGVDLFFVLSGFLITSLLLVEHRRSGRIRLGAFWIRRARRLLPAVLLLTTVLAGYAVWFADSAQRAKLRGDGLATLGYFVNWRFIVEGGSYVDRFEAPSPLKHAWSLAIEEQFYVLWPVVVLLIASVAVRRGVRVDRAVLATCLAGVVASVLVMWALFDPLADPSRVYYGTDTRVHSILIGAGLAAVLRGRPLLAPGKLRVTLVVGATLVLPLLGGATRRLEFFEAGLYRGGFALYALGAALVIVGVVQPGTNPMRRLLESRALVLLGTVSYGLYLWHWPVLVIVDDDRAGFDGPALLALQLALTAAMTALSWVLVERPVARRSWVSPRAVAVTGPVALAAVAAVLVWSTATPGEVVVDATGSRDAPPAVSLGAATPDGGARPPDGAGTGNAPHDLDPAPAPPSRPVRVLLLGDSVAWTIGGGEVEFPQTDRYDSPFPEDRVALWNLAIYACELLPGNSRIEGRERAPSGTCPDWRERWASAVSEFDPHVVLLAPTLWDTYDHKVDGRWLEFGTPPADAEWRTVLDDVHTITTRRGAKLVLLSSAMLDNNREPNTRRSEYWRMQHLNALAEQFAGEHLDTTSYVDLGPTICTDVSCTDDDVLRRDGVHLSREGAERVAEWLLPQIEALVPVAPPTP